MGAFILSFGDVELAAFHLWQKYFPSKAPPANFKERVNKVLGPLRADGQASPVIAELLVEALRLADKRNTVAHHPLSVQVYRHSISGEYVHQLAIASRLTDEYITDEELEALGKKARQLSIAIYEAMWPRVENGV